MCARAKCSKLMYILDGSEGEDIGSNPRSMYGMHNTRIGAESVDRTMRDNRRANHSATNSSTESEKAESEKENLEAAERNFSAYRESEHSGILRIRNPFSRRISGMSLGGHSRKLPNGGIAQFPCSMTLASKPSWQKTLALV